MSENKLDNLIQDIATRSDRSAFSELFRYFAPRIKAFGIRCGAETGRAEELAQEVMLTVWRKAATFEVKRLSASTWIFTIARGKRIDLIRGEHWPEVNTDSSFDTFGSFPIIEKKLKGQAKNSNVRNLLRELPPEQADILEKAYFEDKSQNAVSEEIGLPLGTVKSRVQLALTRLRVILGDQNI